MASVSARRQQIIDVWEWILKKTTKSETFTNEFELCKEFAISRTQLRDILKELEVHGMIERRQRKGIRAHSLSSKEIDDMFEVRCALESMAAKSAIERVTPADIEELYGYVAEFKEAEKLCDTQAELKAEMYFHQKLVGLSNNFTVSDIMKRLMLLERSFRIGRSKVSDSTRHCGRATHTSIVDALAAKDVTLLTCLIKEHINSSKDEAIKSMC